MKKKFKVIMTLIVCFSIVVSFFLAIRFINKNQAYDGEWEAKTSYSYNEKKHKYESLGTLKEPILLSIKSNKTFVYRDSSGEKSSGKLSWNGMNYTCETYGGEVKWTLKKSGGKLSIQSDGKDKGRIIFDSVKKEAVENEMNKKVLNEGRAIQITQKSMKDDGIECDISKLKISDIKQSGNGYCYKATYDDNLLKKYYVYYDNSAKTLNNQWVVTKQENRFISSVGKDYCENDS